MTIDDIRNIIKGGESITLELKKTTGELKDAMRSACALLNTDGGWLIFGATPTTLKIVGQNVTDNTQRELSQALSGLEPAVNTSVEYIDVPEYNGQKVIAIHFDAFVWGNEPYTYEGKPYYRVESTTKQMPRNMFEERLRVHRPQFYAWERQKTDDIGIADLNEDRIRGVVRLGLAAGRLLDSAVTEPIKDILKKFKLLTDDVPNNAAAMLFTKNEKGYYPQFTIQMARFRGTNKNEFIDNQRAYGNFFDLLDAGMAFFFKHLSLSGKITGIRREERLEIPVTALREALINSLCHRQWEKYNLMNGIAIYDDRVEIFNPGVFPKALTPETIKQPHISYPYNPIIANVLFVTKYFENWGSGVGRIVDACREQGLPDPVWSLNGGFVTVTFKRPNYDPSMGQVRPKYDSSIPQVDADDPSSTPQVPPKGDQVGDTKDPSTIQVRSKYDPSTIQVQELIMHMTDQFMSMKSMMEACNFKSRMRFRENYVTPALNDKAIERKYPNEPNHPRQMYKLTEQALEWRTSQEGTNKK